MGLKDGVKEMFGKGGRGGNKVQKNILHEIEFSDSYSSTELLRIQQVISRESSRHRELSAAWSNETAEDRVQRVLVEYNKVKKQKLELQKEIRSEREAKLDAQEWVRIKEGQIERERANHHNQIQRERASHHTQMKDAELKYNERLGIKDQEYGRHVAELEKKHAQEKLKLIQEHQNELSQCLQDNEDLKQDLCSREHSKGFTDLEIALQFKKLSTDIEDFARTEWDPHRETSWPFSEAELITLRPRNVRKLKQQIAQNCLWHIFYEYVFRTPFRIIGDYGQAFDSELYEAHNPEYNSLEEAERAEWNMKRYENAKVFVAALKSSEMWSGNNQAIVESYNEAREAILNVIYDAFTRVTSLDQGERNTLHGILQAAARLWLDACSQRYRLFVILPEDSQDILRLNRGDMSYLQLVIKPELRRFGNSTGSDMSRGESITGWKSQVETYPSSY